MAVVEGRISRMAKGVRVCEFGRGCDPSVERVGARKVESRNTEVGRKEDGGTTFNYQPLTA